MEVRPGYKHTGVGVIPEDWKVSALGMYGRTYGGLTGKSKSDFGRGSGAYVTFLDVMDHVVIDGTRLEAVAVAVGESQNSVQFGDLLFTGSSETPDEVAMCALVAVDQARLYLNSFCFGFRFDPDDEADGLFLTYLIRSSVGRRAVASLAQGSTRYNISKRALLTAPLPLPGRPEQRTIAAVLSDVDALLGGLDRLIAKKRDLKQAAMQQLLTGQTRLPGFNGEWEAKSLGDMGTWRGGMTPSMQHPAYWDGGEFPWISSGDVKTSRLANTTQHVTAWAVRHGVAVVVPAYSIVLVTRSGILRKHLPVALVERPMAINQDIKALVPKEGISAEFLLHALNGWGEKIRASCLKAGTTVESIEFPWLKAFVIPLPPRDEQTAIAAVLTDMDAEVAALEARREKTRDLKQAMMQELLTGRTRLVRPEDCGARAC